MKHRIFTFACITCLMGSFALADNPTDAPVMSNDVAAASSQQKKSARYGRRNPDKKDESRPANDRNKNAYNKKNHQDAQHPDSIGTASN